MSKDVFKQTGPSATHKENVKKYTCPQRNKSFIIKSNLKTHILIRTGAYFIFVTKCVETCITKSLDNISIYQRIT